MKEKDLLRNKALERIRSGEKALGVNMYDPIEELVEMAGRMGLDYVNFEGQHAPMPPERVATLCRIAHGFGVTPTMRIPDGQESTLLSYLDRGIMQVTIPNLLTREQAEDLVKYAYFAPKGLRSSTGYSMVMFQDGPDRVNLFKDANENVVISPQIESIVAVNNLDEILKVDGIEFFGGGNEDMAQSMGIPGGHADPRVLDVYTQTSKRLKAAGKAFWGDVTESVNVTSLVQAAATDLLEKHGRKSGLTF